MGVVMIKRPVIFARNLTHEEVIKLVKYLEKLYSNSTVNYPPNFQIYANKEGELRTAISSNVYSEEIECNSYDEFMTHWEQYRLSQLL